MHTYTTTSTRVCCRRDFQKNCSSQNIWRKQPHWLIAADSICFSWWTLFATPPPSTYMPWYLFGFLLPRVWSKKKEIHYDDEASLILYDVIFNLSVLRAFLDESPSMLWAIENWIWGKIFVSLLPSAPYNRELKMILRFKTSQECLLMTRGLINPALGCWRMMNMWKKTRSHSKTWRV